MIAIRRFGIFLLLTSAPQAIAQYQALIKLNLVATDAKGAPVADLTAHDIQIREDGAPRPLQFFRFAGGRRQMAQSSANEFVNRPGPVPIVILLDRWNQEQSTAVMSWQDVAATVGHMETVDRVYIYVVSNRGALVPVRPLPGAETDLRAAEPLSAAVLVAKFNDSVRSLTGLRDMANVDPVERADKTLQALRIIAAMAALPGPKVLVWVTHGFPIQFFSMTQNLMDYTHPLRDLAQEAVRAQVAIYSVDQSAAGAGADPAGLARQTLELVSSRSGGRWFSSGRTEDALTAVANDARGSYQVAYSTPLNARKTKEPKLRVEAARKGVRLLTRTGFTGDEAISGGEEAVEDVFTRQSHSPFEATEIALRAMRTLKPGALHLEVHVDPADLFQGGALSVQFALYRERALESRQPIFEPDGTVISRDVTVGDKIDQVRVMVFDRGIQGLGSVTVPVK